MYKKLLILFLLFNSYLFSANYSSFKSALKKEKYDKAMSIYSEKINGEQTIKYQEYIYKHIIKLMKKDIQKAEYLLKLYLDVEYENHIGLFLYSQIHLMNENYNDAIEVLYKLKGYYLEDNLAKKVDSVFDKAITNYLEKLYTNNNLNSLKQLIDFFTAYDDIASIKKPNTP